MAYEKDSFLRSRLMCNSLFPSNGGGVDARPPVRKGSCAMRIGKSCPRHPTPFASILESLPFFLLAVVILVGGCRVALLFCACKACITREGGRMPRKHPPHRIISTIILKISCVLRDVGRCPGWRLWKCHPESSTLPHSCPAIPQWWPEWQEWGATVLSHKRRRSD